MEEGSSSSETKSPQFNSSMLYLDTLNILNRRAHDAGINQQYHLLLRILDEYQLELIPRLIGNKRKKLIEQLEALQKESHRLATVTSTFGPKFVWAFKDNLYRWRMKLYISAHEEGLIMADKPSEEASIEV
tara:strand:- start:1543 stop:1935 length:393 start_codon:yes stop_codon:yes gene_type:complete